jgi:hypothetical protein
MAKQVHIPLLKVQALPGGRISANHREGAKPPLDDGWWRDVLLDPRALRSVSARLDHDSQDSHYRLDRQAPRLALTCPCGRQATLNRDEMIKQVGGDMNVLYFAREYLDCKARNKVSNWCQARVI